MNTGALQGMRVMVTRPEGQNDTLVLALSRQGAQVVEAPVLRCVSPTDDRPLLQALSSLAGFDWMALTSVNGVRAVAQRMRAHGLVLPTALRLAAIGPATAKAMQSEWPQAGEVFVPGECIAEELAAELPIHPGERVLLPQARRARPVLADGLIARHALVTCVEAYDVAAVDTDSFLRSVGSIAPDWIVLTSPTGIASLAHLLQTVGLADWLTQCRLACIGPVTAEACVRMGLTVDLIAPIHTESGLVDALAAQGGKDK